VGWGKETMTTSKVVALLEKTENPAFFAYITHENNDNHFAGYVVSEHRFSSEYEERELYVRYLAVNPEFSRMGIGTKLMQSIFKTARSENLAVSLKHEKTFGLYNFYGRFDSVLSNSLRLDFNDFVKPRFNPTRSLKAIQSQFKPDVGSANELIRLALLVSVLVGIFIAFTKFKPTVF
jgi:GNAT superfamily N-acetyltransferase